MKTRASFNGICLLVFSFLFVQRFNLFQNPFSKNTFLSQKDVNFVERRKLYEISHFGENQELVNNILRITRNPEICTGIHQHKVYDSKCEYLKANRDCNSGGFFDYIWFFYCDCEKFKVLGYLVLTVWLVTLFYLLGNTAADYFCCCLEKLSSLLQLAPTVAGVTLLPLGNGAPDVFASIAAFTGSDSGDVGLNGVLGGAVFVTCIVVGVVSICVADKSVRIDKKCFVRDVVFLLIAVVSVLVVLLVGKVSVGGGIVFVLVYVVYTLFVVASEMLRKYGRRLKLESSVPLLPDTGLLSAANADEDEESGRVPLLQSDSVDGVPHLQAQLPHWVWSNNVAIYANNLVHIDNEGHKHLWDWNEEEEMTNEQSSSFCSKLCYLLELPLALPRKLTIPMVEESRWSKLYAVASACFAPLLLAFLWSTQDSVGNKSKQVGCIIGALLGFILGLLACIYTRRDFPPQRFLFPWVLGGFLMSVTWFYIIANELVALLVAFGVVLGIKPSLLALTIMAWGNSMGDLTSNVAIARNGGDGVQIAMSGCYAGPMFNILAGLGISLLLGALSEKPAPYSVPKDATLYVTLGALVLGILWSLVILPKNGMRPNKLLGMGLIAIYLLFLTFRVCIALREGSAQVSS